MTTYAHSVQGRPESEWETLADHLSAVARRASDLASAFGAEKFGYALGALHDIGKIDPAFKRRLDGENVRVDHSTAGAVVAVEKYGRILGKMLAFSIAGHHAGLANGSKSGGGISSLKERLSNSSAPVIPSEMDLSPPAREFTPALPMIQPGFNWEFAAPFLTRMLFSALVDADFMETERFYSSVLGHKVDRGCNVSLKSLIDSLTAHMTEVASKAAKTPVNQLRSTVLDRAIEAASSTPGLFSLTVPTGGGKTLTSAAFGLNHAIHNGQRRIIYVIPFTSIIEQTADVLRGALGNDDAILEHHSAFDLDRAMGDDWSGSKKLRLDAQNWNRPVVVTTSVQFFESLFANRPSRCRKLHAIAKSVIIVDEAQTMPLKLLRPCVEALKELVRGYGCSVVLCTATQPALNAKDGFWDGFKDVVEIAPDPASLYRSLKRVDVQYIDKRMSDEDLADRFASAEQVMCIVNNRRHAKELYSAIAHQEGARHLSTWMCAAHRRDVLAAIKDDLVSGRPVRLISTSLVEAGVDISFPQVWRALAGLDSIIQAAGRCNRNGELPEGGNVFVFRPEDTQGRKPPPELEQAAAVAMTVLRQHGDDPINLNAVRQYFQDLYWRRGEDELDGAMVGEEPGAVRGILRAFREHKSSGDYPFADVAKAFRIITSHDVPLIVPYGGYADVVSELMVANSIGGIARKLQQYLVQVSPAAKTGLVNDGHAEVIRQDEFGDQFVILKSEEMYGRIVGLQIPEIVG